MSAEVLAIKSLFSDLFAKLMSFALEEEFIEDLGDSLEVFYNLQEGEEYEFNPPDEFLFLSWFLLDDSDANGNCLMDEFIDRYSEELSLQEKQVCKALKETNLTLLKVIGIKENESLTLKDLFLGEEFVVSESVAADGISEGSLLFTRVLRLVDTRFLVGAGVFLDESVTEYLTAFITEQYKQDCEDGFKISFKEFLKQNAELINWWIRAYEKGEIFDEGDEEDPEGENPDDQEPDKKGPEDKVPPTETPKA